MNTSNTAFWIAVSLYGCSAFAYIFGLVAKSPKLFFAGLLAAIAGFFPHATSIALRWISTGVTPFISIAESLDFAMLTVVLIFVLVQLVTRSLKPLGVLVMPVAFALMGWSGTLMEAASTKIAPALQSGWIWFHIISAASGFACVLIASGIALIFLLKERGTNPILDKVPDVKVLDEYTYRFVGAGFILYALMIISGCFWANQVKGSYWNWDPVEVWSLVSWLTYGVYLHLRVSLGWRGRKLAIYALFAAALMIVSYWGIPFSMETFHRGFRIDHGSSWLAPACRPEPARYMSPV